MHGSLQYSPLADTLPGRAPPSPEPRIFVSYHHANDQVWYDEFTRLYGDVYELFTDRSLDRQIDSGDADYVRRAIREHRLTGSSMTIVLCGTETWKRRWVDWEIQMTLNKKHALLGIILPTNQADVFGRFVVPARLYDNITSGYASWTHWPLSNSELSASIGMGKVFALRIARIDNSRPAMKRKLS